MAGANLVGRPSAKARRCWREARHFHERAHQVLSECKVTFLEWLLLETLQELSDQTNATVSETELVRHSGVSECLVSYWMLVMSELDVVARSPSADGSGWRLALTAAGAATLQACNQLLEESGLTE